MATVNTNEQWTKFLAFIKNKVNNQDYITWFEPMKFISFIDNKLTIQVPNLFICEFIEEHFPEEIREALRLYFGHNIELSYKEKRQIKENNINVADSNEEQPKKIEFNSNLDNILTFENFIEGDCNKLPRTIGMTIATKPNQDTFNPFFVHGSSGVGKSHLLNAIGIKLKENFPDKRILYVPASQLIAQYTSSHKTGTYNDFINYYQSIDCLIVDDIQTFEGKTGTQETFFAIFNHLQHNHRQIILSSDRPPVMMKDIEERLLTRFKWGIVAELDTPDAKLRKEILSRLIKRNGMEISDNIINYIANNITQNVRDLIGIVNTLVARSIVEDCEITMDLAQRIVSKIVDLNKNTISIEKILKIVSKELNVPQKDILAKVRKASIVEARQITMYLAKKFTQMSTSQIGSAIGHRDHATVIYACKSIDNRILVERNFRTTIERLEKELHTN